jgi:hypothetical protein
MSWTTQPHGPLEQHAENLWSLEGSMKGLPLKRRMTVARRKDGSLVIHSAVALAEPQMAELEALGKPAVLVVPSGYHRIDAPRFKARYPELTVLAPVRARKKVEERVAVDGTYEDFAADEVVELRTLQGTGGAEGLMLVRSSDGLTAVVNDVIFNMDRGSGLRQSLMYSVFGWGPGARVSRLAKLGIVKDRGVLRRELSTLAEDPALVRLIVAHDKVATGPDAAAAIRQALTHIA